jgi:two-component system, cell cycle sensor histidine kinase and response regulator CckA
MPRTRIETVALNHAVNLKNRISSPTMSKPQAARRSSAMVDPLALVSAGGNILVVFLVFLACAAVILALLAAQASEPFILTVMGLLATLGVFFLFGTAAGHIRLSDRSTDAELLHFIGDRIDDGVLLTSLSGNVIYANAAATRQLGRNELGALNTLEEALAGSAAGAEALFRLTGLVKRGGAGSEDIAIPSADRTSEPVRWLRISVKPAGQVDGAGHTGKAALWSLTDVTIEKARSERAKLGLQSRLDMLEAMPAGFLRVDAEGRLFYVSRLLAGWLGLEAERPERPTLLTEITAGNAAELIQSMVRGGPNRSGPQRLDLDLVRRDGRRWPATIVVQPAEDSAAPGHLDAVVIARTDTHGDVEAVELTGRPFASLFQSAPFGIATLSGDGRIVSANSAFTRLLMAGRAASDDSAIDILTRQVDADKRAEIAAALEAASTGKANIAPVEIELGANSEFTRRVFFNSLAGPAEARGPVVLYVTDATEEKALGVKFAQSQKMEAIGKLAGGIAHDFNNVLTAIIGFSDLLLTSHRPGDHAYKNIQNIRSSANHAAGLVKQLLAFSRRQTLTIATLHLNEVVTDLSVMLNRLLGENVELKIKSGRDVWPVKADPNQLNQVIMNLAVNAGDAMPDGGRLSIRTRNISERESQRRAAQGMPVGQYVLLEVEDTGTGMAPEVLKKIFEPFFTTKDVGKGTGLGLATVYGIIKQTGGYIFADSEPGIGTTFQVYLPRYIETEEDLAAARAAPPPETRKRDLTGNGRVLIVEDEDAVRMFAVEALKRQGYEVVEASDGFDALEILEDHGFEFDLVVSDVKMPEMDGPTLYKEVRKAGSDVKFIFVSGYADDAFAKQLDANDKYTFLPKPYTLAQIAEKVKEQLT